VPPLTRARWLVVVGAAALVLAATMGAALFIGPAHLSLARALDATLHPNFDREILLAVRLPRVLLGALTGAALAAAGVAFQGLLRNALADPYVLGVSGGAALGGTAAIAAAAGLRALAAGGTIVGAALRALGPAGTGAFLAGPYALPLAAFAGAALSILVVHRVALAARGGALTILLVGAVFNAFAAAVITFVKSIVAAEKAQELLYWLMGTLAAGAPPLALGTAALLALTGIGALLLATPRLNWLALGPEAAAHLGVNVARTETFVFLAASLAVGATVALTGLISFVGLIVPHGLRLWLGPDHRLLLPAAALGGAAFLVACDAATRALFLWLATEPPVGVVTAFAGGPFFLWLLRRGATRYRLDAAA
jgi:iron complex transport system permease protein